MLHYILHDEDNESITQGFTLSILKKLSGDCTTLCLRSCMQGRDCLTSAAVEVMGVKNKITTARAYEGNGRQEMSEGT